MYRNSLKPVHVFHLNFFGLLALHLFVYLVFALLAIWPISEDFCIHYFLPLITIMSLCLGIISMQIDRFSAVFWDLKYDGHFTTSRAIKVCCLNVMIATAMGIGAGLIDNNYAKCSFPQNLIFTRMTNIVLDGIPKLISVVVTIIVTIYLIKTTKRLENSIRPTAQTRPTEMPMETRRIENQPYMFYHIESVRRDMYAEAGPSQESPTNNEDKNVACLKEKEFVLKVQNITTMNLLTLLFVIGFIPHVILGMVYHNCRVGTGECENYAIFFASFDLLRLIGLFCMEMVTLKRLMTKAD